MRKSHLALILATTFLSQAAFADTDIDMDSDSKPCAKIAKSCLDAGYTREAAVDKRFWQDCMKPVILGRTVDGVNLDTDTVKMCRADKIAKLKKELLELQKSFSNGMKKS
jgi:hypothetical protein